MKIDILTLFPSMFDGVFDYSIVKRAKEDGLVEIATHDLRAWSVDKYRSVDDRPYGGGPGMILKVDVLDRAIEAIKSKSQIKNSKIQINSRVILMDAGGEKFNQKKAEELAKLDSLILVCGHYEGVDHRVHEQIADEIISIGDYVLSGGEIPAMVVVDSLVRLLPGALGNPRSLEEESFLVKEETEYPQYTRPEEYKGWKVPPVLLSGNHREIEKWKKAQVK